MGKKILVPCLDVIMIAFFSNTKLEKGNKSSKLGKIFQRCKTGHCKDTESNLGPFASF